MKSLAGMASLYYAWPSFFPGLSAVMPPLVACGRSVAPAVSLPLMLLGSFLWSGFYVGLGYLFSNELDVAIGWAKHFGTALGIAIRVPIGLYAGWRGLVLLRMIRRLRLRRISPAMLALKLKSTSKVAVLDLLDFEDETDTESPEAIPGAFRVDPSRLQEVSAYQYSGSTSTSFCIPPRRGDIVSARAAMALRRIGVEKVWVLEGGLKAWREQGFPVSQSPEIPEVVAERVGVKLPPHDLLETQA